MGKIRIVTPDRARPIPCGAGVTSRAYMDGVGDPLHLVSHRLEPGAGLRAEGAPNDELLYVLDGSVGAQDVELPAGSSMIVEYGASLDIRAGEDGAEVLAFLRPDRPVNARPGGHVHILPRDHVPRAHDLGMQNEMGGGIHADAACPTCTVWLHENDFHCTAGTVIPLHSHSEDEIIFITAGAIRLGHRRYGRGMALAVAAGTRYGFEAAPEGLSFINFRAASPTVTTARGTSDEAATWIGRLGRPTYLLPTGTSPS